MLQLKRKLKSLHTRLDDSMTNSAGNVINMVRIHQTDRPSSTVWVQLDHTGTKTRLENRQLHVQGIELTWTPIKPVTTEFAIGRNRTAQVLREQFPLQPAAAKTIHRSQGDTDTKVLVNLNTRKAISHIHYVGLSRVTIIEGVHITDLCEHKVTVNSDAKKEMERLKNNVKLDLCISPVYNVDQIPLKLCYLNTRSLHRHTEDVRKDLYSNTDVNIFSETKLIHSDNNSMYSTGGYSLSRNEATPSVNNVRPFGRMTVYSRIDHYPGYPYSCNSNGVEVIVTRLVTVPHLY